MISTVLFSALCLFLASACAKCPDDPLDCLSRPDPRPDMLLDHEDLLMLAASADVAADATATDGRFSLNDTQTAACADNQTLADGKSCSKCSKCPKNGVLLRSCNSTYDTQCMCEKGSYLSILEYECKACSACPHGHGVWKKCTRYRDTKCRQCPPGSYSGVMSDQMGCVLCSTCQSHQIMLQECSRIQNTVCVGEFSCLLSSLPSLPPFATDAQVNLLYELRIAGSEQVLDGGMRESCIRASLCLDRHHEDAEVREDVLHAIPTADSLIYRSPRLPARIPWPSIF